MGKGPVCHPKDVEIEHGPDSPSRQVTIWTLPDDALLKIFNFFANDSKSIHWWHTLVHVCRRWRSIIFASPRHLNLRLRCTQKMPVRKSLDVWPAFPIVILYGFREKVVVDGTDNLIAALERKDRVREIALAGVSRSNWERFMAEMQEPFPELSRLDLSYWDEEDFPSISDSVLGGSAPRLREFCLYGFRFPALREFLLSASGLVKLNLRNIHYISPDDMVSSLSALTSLRECYLHPNASRQGRANPPLPRTVLPALTLFDFEGTGKYLGAFVDLIDAPLLHTVRTFFIFPDPLGDSQFRGFIGRTQQFKAFNKVNVVFQNNRAVVKLSPALRTSGSPTLQMKVPGCDLSSLAQLCSSTLPSLSTIESLDVYEDPRFPLRPENSVLGYAESGEIVGWPIFLRIFIAVKKLCLSKTRAIRVAPSLHEFAGGQGATDVLPALQTIFLEDPRPLRHVQEAIEQFVAARERFGRPVAVGHWERAVDTENG